MSSVAARPVRAKPRRRARRLLLHLSFVVAVLVMVYPLLWMVASSLKPQELIFSDLSLWPEEFDFGNYVSGWRGVGESFSTFFVNSFVISGIAIVGNLISCSMAAYAFARLNFRFKRLWFGVMLLTIMLPFHVTVVPQYTLFLNLGWVNTFYPLIVPKFLAVDAFFIFLMHQFIRGIPRELDEAALVDGCGKTGIYLRIILPLTVPALVTTGIFTFIWTYNDFFSQLIYLSDTELYTVALGLRMFLDAQAESAWGAMFAMTALSLVPVFVIFVGFQRLLVEGIATTGLK